jgi:MFS family permease
MCFGICSRTFPSELGAYRVKGYAAGPLLWGPLSEMYGRAVIFNITNALFVALTIGCGFSNSTVCLIVLRFFAGFNGSACLALGGGARRHCGYHSS